MQKLERRSVDFVGDVGRTSNGGVHVQGDYTYWATGDYLEVIYVGGY